jgi:hypothetical protein
MSDFDDLEGHLTIEGPLLELAYAALCVARGEDVVQRLETLGVYHDIFIKSSKGYTFCECDGEPQVSQNKIDLFIKEVTKLNNLLKSQSELPIIEARFVSMVPVDQWDRDAQEQLEAARIKFGDQGIDLVLVEPKRLLYDLISTSVLGFLLLDNHVIFVGPGQWAIRYNPSISKFVFGESTIDLPKFRELPQSFLARDYWNERHKAIYSKYAEIAMEALPEWFNWKYPDNFGIRWKYPEQMAEAVLKAYSKNGRIIVHTGKHGFVSLRKLKRGSYYAANLIFMSNVIGESEAEEIDRAFLDMIEEFRNSGEMSEDLDFYFRLFSDTMTFSHLYWTKAKFRTPRGEVAYTEIKRGDDVLAEVLNSGDLGLKLDENRIMLSLEEGPNILSLVRGSLQWESSKEGTYPATLKF